MAEYNVQINKYNVNNADYDQLYPQPMKHADTHLLGGSDPIDIGGLGLSNPNLLDNAYWASPDAIIDQRGGYIQIGGTMMYKDPDFTEVFGASSGTTPVRMYGSYARPIDNGTELGLYIKLSDCVRGYTGPGYTVDRWTGGGNNRVLLINDNFITLKNTATGDGNAWFAEWLNNLTFLNNREFTLSILYRTESSDCGVEFLGEASSIYKNMMLPSTDGKWNIASITIPAGAYFGSTTKARWGAFVKNTAIGSIDILGFKIELGSQQTLAHQDANGNWVLNDPSPDKGIELLECIQSTADPSDTYANKVVATRDWAVCKAGDTMTGALSNTIDSIGRASFVGNQNAAYLESFRSDYNTRRQIVLQNIENDPNDASALFMWNSTSNKISTILHTGNKDQIFTYGTADLTAGTSALETGKLYFVYE